MDDKIVTITVALLVSVVAPLILSHQTNKARHDERLEDYARQDQVAAKAEIAAQILAQRGDEVATQAAEAAKLLLAANERVSKQNAESSRLTQGKLSEIHTLVNSSLTTAMQGELSAREALLPLMLEVIRLNTRDGSKPDPAALDSVTRVEKKIDELRSTVDTRLRIALSEETPNNV